MNRTISVLGLLAMMTGCFKGEKVDLIIHNAIIHTMNDGGDVFEAIAIKDGKILQVGPEREILNRYRGEIEINAGKKDVYPGLHDAHGHIFGEVYQRLQVDLVGSSSYYDMLLRLEKFAGKNQPSILIGRGWDQGLWGESELPTNKLLNERFPDLPVVLIRVDGHAMLLNDLAMRMAGIDSETRVEGGQVVIKDGSPSGVILDQAMDLMQVHMASPDRATIKQKITEIQSDLLAYGITHVHEAGISIDQLEILLELDAEGLLQIQVYAMLFLNDDNLGYAEKNGFIDQGNVHVRGFKLLLDGALGSRGACLIHPYADAMNEHGLLLTSMADLQRLTKKALALDFQVNTHCIGDSANRILLRHYDTLLTNVVDHRWRIEHAQVIHEDDFQWFSKTGVIPSVQPTHAASDQRWIKERLGTDRMKTAYAYKTLLNERGMLALGTDFPVESYNPFGTIHAAVQRKTLDGEPQGGFQIEEALTLEETMRGMTIWAAFACFEEHRVGSLEKGKDATFTIFEYPIRSTLNYEPNGANETFIRGKKVY
jgi:predicted amidohydrolase YtcJ